MANDLKINQANFSMPRSAHGRHATGRRPSMEGVLKKSSYTIPEETQKALKVLAATVGVNMNVLVQEAFEDLLDKYGQC